MKTVQIKYFAILRDAADKSEETWQTSADSVAALYQELQRRYPGFLAAHSVRVAINHQFCTMAAPLRHNDQVVFIPPVAGG